MYQHETKGLDTTSLNIDPQGSVSGRVFYLAAIIAGFVSGAFSIILAIESSLDQSGLPPSGVVAMLFVGAGILSLVTGHWPSFRVVFLASAATAYLSMTASQSDVIRMVGPFFVATVFAMLATFRVHAIWYLLFASSIGLVVGDAVGSVGSAVGAALTTSIALALCNYLTKLVLDHRHEIRQIPSFIQGVRPTLILTMLLIWSPAVFLAAVGWMLNDAIQNQVREALYAGELIMPDPEMSDQHGASRDIQADIIYTINQHERVALLAYETSIQEGSVKVDDSLSAVQKGVASVIDAQRPTGIDEHAACAHAAFRLKFGIKIRLGTLCRGIVRAVESAIDSTYRKGEARINAMTSARVAELRAAKSQTEVQAREDGVRFIQDTYEGYRASARLSLLALKVARYIGYIMLVGALVAALQLALGRVMFDLPADSLKKGHANGMTFQLSSEGIAEGLDWSAANEVKLIDHGGRGRTWYASFRVARAGNGTEQWVRVPHVFECSLQRAFTGRLLLTRIDVPKTGASTPILSVPGDLKLVCIDIQKGQEINFRMSDLIAFSDGVRLRSVYSTHVGAQLLGLASFYSVATGDGTIVLESEGEGVARAKRGMSVPATRLLAWDRRHEFSLAQRLSVFGVWLNEPSLRILSESGAAVLDESRPTRMRFARRLWSVSRYLFLPF